jgi:hypothetical protein
VHTLCFKSEAPPAVTQSIQRPSASSVGSLPIVSDQFVMQVSAPSNQSQLSSASSGLNKFDLLADFGGDPFAGPAVSSKSTGLFLPLLVEVVKMSG